MILVLKWHHQFQFAGYYAALEKGFFRAEGLDVEIRATESGPGPLADVLAGKVQYAVGDGSLVLVRLQGTPVVVVTPIFQSSPLALYTRAGDKIVAPEQLKGKRLMIGDPAENISILAMLHEAGLGAGDFTNVSHSYSYDDLFQGKVDGISAYTTTAPAYFAARREEVNALKPLNYGIDFYGDLLYTSQREVENHLDRALAVRRAVLRGWQYALDHPGELINVIRSRYHANYSVADLQSEAAETHKMIRPEYIELGHLSPSRLRRIADVFAAEGFVPADRSIHGLILDDYLLHDNGQERALRWLTAVILATLLTIGSLFAINYRLRAIVAKRTEELSATNARLKTELEERARAEAELKEAHDLLEQRVAERTAQLEAANRSQEAFNYSVSHDLRGPLRALDGFSKILLQDYGATLDEEGRELLVRIHAAANRMGSLVDDLLMLSRLDRSEPRVSEVDLSEIAEEAAAKLHETDPSRKVEWVIAPAVKARGDAVLLSSLLDNLLGNAWKYTGKHDAARIEFGARKASGNQVFFVKDDGAGFDMEYSAGLFSPFHRLHADSDFPGSGIGLATVQRIVELHGGKVWAEAKIERGATFYFMLRSRK